MAVVGLQEIFLVIIIRLLLGLHRYILTHITELFGPFFLSC